MPHGRPARLSLGGRPRSTPLVGLLLPALAASAGHLASLPRPDDWQRQRQQQQQQRRAVSHLARPLPADPRLTKGAKVVVSLSGGVDSSVALRLLAEHVSLPHLTALQSCAAADPGALFLLCPSHACCHRRCSLYPSRPGSLLCFAACPFSKPAPSPSRPQDLNLSAVFMRNWSIEEEDTLRGCEWERDWEDVRRICAHVGGVPCELVRPRSNTSPFALDVRTAADPGQLSFRP